jgi:hypothetical protein
MQNPALSKTNLLYKLWIYYLGTNMNLFESEISKLNLTPTAKETIIQLRKICLESEGGEQLEKEYDAYEQDGLEDGEESTVDEEALKKAEALFASNGGHSKILQQLAEFLDDEWCGSGFEIRQSKEYNPSDDNFPRAYLYCTSSDFDFCIDVRANFKGLLSYVIWDEKTDQNMNGYLCEYRDVDPSTLDDKYELSKKYTLDEIHEMFNDISTDISSINLWFA